MAHLRVFIEQFIAERGIEYGLQFVTLFFLNSLNCLYLKKSCKFSQSYEKSSEKPNLFEFFRDGVSSREAKSYEKSSEKPNFRAANVEKCLHFLYWVAIKFDLVSNLFEFFRDRDCEATLRPSGQRIFSRSEKLRKKSHIATFYSIKKLFDSVLIFIHANPKSFNQLYCCAVARHVLSYNSCFTYLQMLKSRLKS